MPETLEKLDNELEVIKEVKGCTVKRFCSIIGDAAERFYKMHHNDGFDGQYVSGLMGTIGDLMENYGKFKLEEAMSKDIIAFDDIKYLVKETIKERTLPGIPGKASYSSKEQLIWFLKSNKRQFN